MILALWYHTILSFVFAVLAILLMIVILLQRGRGVGLAGAFGGAGGAGGAFGAKTGDFLTWITIVGAAVYLLFAVALNFAFVPSKTNIGATKTTPPAATETAEPAAPLVVPATPTPAPATPVPATPTPAPPPPAGGFLLPDETIPRPTYAHLGIFGTDGHA